MAILFLGFTNRRDQAHHYPKLVLRDLQEGEEGG